MRVAILLAFGCLALAQTPESLRTKLSYLASDELEGRGTPSLGLDLAAAYIADQFHKAGLAPANPDGTWFQVALYAEVTNHLEQFSLTLKAGEKTIVVAKDEVRIRSLVGLELSDAPVLSLPASGAIPPIVGRVVAGDVRRYGTEEFLETLQSRQPALILLIGPARRAGGPPAARPYLEERDAHHAPVLRINRADLADFFQEAGVSLTLHVEAPAIKESTARNVAAVLPGSDIKLKAQYVMVTAHYDHLGSGPKGIFHGANDNASGTVSVIEIAAALAALPAHPKRSILFVTFYGEEEGLLGSYFYARHPLVPLKDTIANINFEQLGRTDDDSGPEVGAIAFTGPDFSDLPAAISAGAAKEGVKTYPKADADDFFQRSDNYAFALRGIPDTTVAVAFDYPDYHGLGDTADKIDYENLARVDQGIAAGILRVANDPAIPKWSENPAASIYKEASR